MLKGKRNITPTSKIEYLTCLPLRVSRWRCFRTRRWGLVFTTAGRLSSSPGESEHMWHGGCSSARNSRLSIYIYCLQNKIKNPSLPTWFEVVLARNILCTYVPTFRRSILNTIWMGHRVVWHLPTKLHGITSENIVSYSGCCDTSGSC